MRADGVCGDVTYSQPMWVHAGLDGVRAARVACGARHCVLVAADGGCFAWGDGTFGALGQGQHVVSVTTPCRVVALQVTLALTLSPTLTLTQPLTLALTLNLTVWWRCR